MDHALFDQRRYPVLPPRAGYAEWAPTYDASVPPEMDLRLLGRLELDWAAAAHVLDLACGTGRIGAWLRGRGVRRLTGLDLTPEMLARAEAGGTYDHLAEGDVRATFLPGGAYDLILMVLAEEHLPELAPLYAEAARLAAPAGARFVLVGYHPHMLMCGIPTHFDRADGSSATIESHVHLLSDHFRAARAAGWALEALEEGLVDQAWVARKPRWARFLHHPVSFAAIWVRGAAG
ncbi:MAG TPA: class I SAM-dependent methyltransferase [Crenalkalicoccus sp.]|jgi:SAM-dependent methyltransferase|nr:class I SAM-dependent methyltransferase [Crenalkalicoccus sp.]